MAITKQTQPYEVLFRFKNGVYSGGHIVDIERIIDDDGETVLAEKQLSARSLDKAGLEYADIVCQINATIEAENVALKAENVALKAENVALKAENTALKASLPQAPAPVEPESE